MANRDAKLAARVNEWLTLRLEEDDATGITSGYRTGPHSVRVRVALIKIVGERCEDCGKLPYEFREKAVLPGGPLEVHHRHYDSVGREMLEDVELLCRDCHETRPRPARPGLPWPPDYDLGPPSIPRRAPLW